MEFVHLVHGMSLPHSCWLSAQTVWAFVAPALLLLMVRPFLLYVLAPDLSMHPPIPHMQLYIAAVLVAVVILVKQKDATTTGGGHTTTLSVVMNSHKIRCAITVGQYQL